MMQPEDFDPFSATPDIHEKTETPVRRRQLNAGAAPGNNALPSQRLYGERSQQDLSAFDPFSPKRSVVQSSLLDTVDEDEEEGGGIALQPSSSLRVPGAAGYLEMEEEPPRSPEPYKMQSPYEPIKTSSGLLLTHRRTPPVPKLDSSQLHQQPVPDDDTKKLHGPTNLFGAGGLKRSFYRERFEMDHFSSGPGRQLLSYARLWIVLSAVVLLIGAVVVVHHMRFEGSDQEAQQPMAGESIQFVPLEQAPFAGSSSQTEEQGPIVLLPLPETQIQQLQQQQPATKTTHHGGRRLMAAMTDLRSEFEDWASQHGKRYHSLKEKKRRFKIWVQNHHRTIEKNKKHGPCKMTKQPVFGSNYLKDLTHEEFTSQYLTGYTGPTADKEPPSRSSGVLGPHIEGNRHPEIHRRLQDVWKSAKRQATDGVFGTECDWYDVSCLLVYVFDTYFYGLGRTMEPKYDADSYPTSMDWRDFGAVGSVRAQGNCGACWAITAIQTVESAIFIATQTMYELSETEVIVCADECEMCAGGWPQEAIEYVMDHGGVPSLNDVPYDGDWLLGLSQYRAGEANNDDFDAYTASTQASQMCSADSKSNSGSGSGDQQQDDGGQDYSYARYGGEVEGYGYATKKCVCYTDGTGCECNSQNEGMAVRNVATYGPAVVCFDASTWQDYAGGIITSASGCSQGFMDVNHCAQVVGYAYDSDEEDDNAEGGGGGNSHSGSGSADEKSDSGNRAGYWIVRNQWSSYWGMSGYAYVAMGENTCGILNDMLLAYA